jgi:hypothetical protein
LFLHALKLPVVILSNTVLSFDSRHMSLTDHPPPGSEAVEVSAASERTDASPSEAYISSLEFANVSESTADQALGDAMFSLLGLPFEKLEQQLHVLK